MMNSKQIKKEIHSIVRWCKINDHLFLYADSANPHLNYYLDDIDYGEDAKEYLSIVGLKEKR